MFQFCNDTKRRVSIHPGTSIHGCTTDKENIMPLEICTFHLPKGKGAWVKMWDYGEERGLQILVTPTEGEFEFQFYNDTQREVSIHSGTAMNDCVFDKSPISHSETCTFKLPNGTFPWVKMWDYREKGGLQILVMPSTGQAG